MSFYFLKIQDTEILTHFSKWKTRFSQIEAGRVPLLHLISMRKAPSVCRYLSAIWCLSRWLSGKGSACQCRGHGFGPWVREIPWRRKLQPTPVFMSGESHGIRSLMGYSPWGRKESDTTEQLNRHTCSAIWVHWLDLCLCLQMIFIKCFNTALDCLWHPPLTNPHCKSIRRWGLCEVIRNGNPLQYFLPGEFHRQRSLVGYSQWGCKELNMAEHTHTEGLGRMWICLWVQL